MSILSSVVAIVAADATTVEGAVVTTFNQLLVQLPAEEKADFQAGLAAGNAVLQGGGTVTAAIGAGLKVLFAGEAKTISSFTEALLTSFLSAAAAEAGLTTAAAPLSAA